MRDWTLLNELCFTLFKDERIALPIIGCWLYFDEILSGFGVSEFGLRVIAVRGSAHERHGRDSASVST